MKDIIKKYLKEEKENIDKTIIEFFKNNPNPPDSKVHEFAEKLGIDEHKFEELIYKLLSSFFGEGRSKEFDGKYDPEELKKGIDIEKEHTTHSLIAERIAMDHLAEIPDYYTRLIKMEKEAGIED